VADAKAGGGEKHGGDEGRDDPILNHRRGGLLTEDPCE
jgi:hypothetical protein